MSSRWGPGMTTTRPFFKSVWSNGPPQRQPSQYCHLAALVLPRGPEVQGPPSTSPCPHRHSGLRHTASSPTRPPPRWRCTAAPRHLPKGSRRVGWAQAAFNVASMREAGLRVPMVWVDVQPYRVAPWSKSPAGNNAVIDGVLAGYKAAGFRTGIYSYDGGWKPPDAIPEHASGAGFARCSGQRVAATSGWGRR